MAYASISDLETLGVRAQAVSSIPATEKSIYLASASETMDSYLKSVFDLPLQIFGTDIKRVCAIIAAYDMLSVRGSISDSGSDKNMRARYDDAIKWLEQVKDGTVIPVGVVDSSQGVPPGETAARARILSNPTRGYSSRGTDSGHWPFEGD